MASSDVFTISALLVLIVGAVCFYLYTRIKQVEKKVALVEGILLDLKTATEASFMDFPAASSYMLAKDFGDDDDEEEEEQLGSGEGVPVGGNSDEVEELPFVPFASSNMNTDISELDEVEPGSEALSAPAPSSTVVVTKVESVTPDLELLTAKELMAIARSKGLNVGKAMRKQQLIDLINAASAPPAPVAEAVSSVEEASDDLDGLAAESSLLNATTLDSAPF